MKITENNNRDIFVDMKNIYASSYLLILTRGDEIAIRLVYQSSLNQKQIKRGIFSINKKWLIGWNIYIFYFNYLKNDKNLRFTDNIRHNKQMPWFDYSVFNYVKNRHSRVGKSQGGPGRCVIFYSLCVIMYM